MTLLMYATYQMQMTKLFQTTVKQLSTIMTVEKTALVSHLALLLNRILLLLADSTSFMKSNNPLSSHVTSLKTIITKQSLEGFPEYWRDRGSSLECALRSHTKYILDESAKILQPKRPHSTAMVMQLIQ